MSGPVPSPSMNGIIGSSGTISRPLTRVMADTVAGGLRVVNVAIEHFRLGHPTAGWLRDLHKNCGKGCGNQMPRGAVVPINRCFPAVCTRLVRVDPTAESTDAPGAPGASGRGHQSHKNATLY